MGLNILMGCVLGAALPFLSGCATHDLDKSSSSGRLLYMSTDIRAQAMFRPGVLFSVDVEVDGKSEVVVDSLRLRATGEVVLPIVGSTKLSGLSLGAAAEHLISLYSPYYIAKPIVRLQFLEDKSGQSSPWGYVTVLGRVRKPGRVNLPPTRDMTVSGAIQDADGFDTSANLEAVRITRTGTDQIKTQMVVDINSIGAHGDVEQDLPLRSGDIIYVPEKIF
jgi:protein involved in polysaccharide export with SLBB domain